MILTEKSKYFDHTLRLFEMNDSVIIFEHVDFVNILQRLYSYIKQSFKYMKTFEHSYQISWLLILVSCPHLHFADLHASSFFFEFLLVESYKKSHTRWVSVPFPPIWVGFPNFAASLALASDTSWSILTMSDKLDKLIYIY